jgi:hypothetical protein
MNCRVLLAYPPYTLNQTVPPLGSLLHHLSHRPELAGHILSKTFKYYANPDKWS